MTHEIERFDRMQKNRLELGYQNRTTQKPTLERRPFVLPPPNFDPDLVSEVKTRISITLIVINAVILGLSGLLGYFLAGRTLKPIKEMVDEQNRFISDASHEIRTPLTALKSSMEVFLRESEPTMADTRELIKGSVKDVDRLKELSDVLLELAYLKNLNGNIKSVSVSMQDIIKDAISQVAKIAHAKKIDIINETQEVVIEGSSKQLKDLMVNLLENSIKYSNKPGNIYIRCNKTDSHLSLSIKDEGIGISQNDLPHIFERFYRADISRTSTAVSGFGLGLAIARSIVEKHHGKIYAESVISKGTTMHIVLPIKQPRSILGVKYFSKFSA